MPFFYLTCLALCVAQIIGYWLATDGYLAMFLGFVLLLWGVLWTVFFIATFFVFAIFKLISRKYMKLAFTPKRSGYVLSAIIAYLFFLLLTYPLDKPTLINWLGVGLLTLMMLISVLYKDKLLATPRQLFAVAMVFVCSVGVVTFYLEKDNIIHSTDLKTLFYSKVNFLKNANGGFPYYQLDIPFSADYLARLQAITWVDWQEKTINKQSIDEMSQVVHITPMVEKLLNDPTTRLMVDVQKHSRLPSSYNVFFLYNEQSIIYFTFLR